MEEIVEEAGDERPAPLFGREGDGPAPPLLGELRVACPRRDGSRLAEGMEQLDSYNFV